MSALSSLPRRLTSLLSAIDQAAGPVRVIVDDDAQIDLVTRACRAAGIPLSPPSRTASREVESGATRGYVTGPEHPAAPGATAIRLADVPLAAPNPVLEARIKAALDEHWRAGVDLPALGTWPSGVRLPAASRLLPGKALADRRDLGLGEDVAAAIDGPDGPFAPVLRGPCAEVLGGWQQLRGRTAISAVVASGLPGMPVLSAHLAVGAAALLNASYAGELTGNEPPSGCEDPQDRVSRLASQLRLDPARVDVSQIAGQHVLLVGASWTQGWTMTVSGQLLLSAGAQSVRPFTLSSDIRQARRR